MTAEQYISAQKENRREVLGSIHEIILQEDPTVACSVGQMMGKEMILYKEKGHFKYGLAGAGNYMTMHLMPIYGGSPLHSKYLSLLPDAKFQKGCINFRAATDVPLPIVRRLLADCARVSIASMMEQY